MHSQILKNCLSPKKLTFPMTKYILTYLTNSKYNNIFYWKAFLEFSYSETVGQYFDFQISECGHNAKQMGAQIQTLNVI